MKIVFMGSPDYAANVLKCLVEAGHEITLVVTNPDRPKGRGKDLAFTPVKEYALSKGLPVFQPSKIKLPENVSELRKYEADAFVVAAFGQILSQEILDMPKYGSINVHASLLPQLRGASPIQQCILDGHEKTGITIMQMDAGIDTGDIILKEEVVIDPRETFESLCDKLDVAAGKAIIKAMEKISAGTATRTKQGDNYTYAKLISKEMGRLDFAAKTAIQIDRIIRAFNPWPAAFTTYQGKGLKIYEAYPVEDPEGCPGEIVAVSKDSFTVKCKEGALEITEICPEGKKRMTVHDFLLGKKMVIGDKLGE